MSSLRTKRRKVQEIFKTLVQERASESTQALLNPIETDDDIEIERPEIEVTDPTPEFNFEEIGFDFSTIS